MSTSSLKRRVLSEAIKETFQKLYGYAMALTRNPTDAEDLVQETCVRAIEAVETVHPEKNVKSWLFTILRNVWRNQVRQRVRSHVVDLDGLERSAAAAVEPGRDPHALYVSKVESARVRQALENLPEDAREIILLREFAELSYEEIADVLRCPPGTVMSRLARARSKLRAILSFH